MYNDKLVYKVVIWAFFGISLWKEKVGSFNLASIYVKGNQFTSTALRATTSIQK